MLLVVREGSTTTITINRREARNSLHPELLKQVPGLLRTLSADGETRCLVIRGAGDKAFCGGYDIGSIPEGEAGAADDALHPALTAIVEFPFPVIAMISGYCIGAGLALAVSCDFCIAADTAQFAMSPAKLGILYDPSGVQRIAALVGVAWTKYLLCTGRMITAQRAKEIGLVQELVALERLEDYTLALAGEIGENAPLSVIGAKQTVNVIQNFQRASATDLAEMRAQMYRCLASDDAKEGRRAFKEKRKPAFQGR